jgi:hypothetical protein
MLFPLPSLSLIVSKVRKGAVFQTANFNGCTFIVLLHLAKLDQFSLTYTMIHLFLSDGRENLTLWNGPHIYEDTKSKMSSLLMFNRVYNRLEIQSVMLVFSTPLVN